MNYISLLEQTENYVEMLYKKQQTSDFSYHNLNHIKNVVTAATQIANYYQLNDRDCFIVITSAWFHDIGYLKTLTNHEEAGANEAAAFLSAQGLNRNDIDAVKQCILATCLPQHPHNLLEEIICDADLYHLGSGDFFNDNKLLRKEEKSLRHKDHSKQAWLSETISLLQSHNYFTEYCRSNLEEKKQENLNKLISKQHKLELKHYDDADTNKEKNKDDAVAENTEDLKSEKETNRRMEVVFRVTSASHERLSDMADNKSHILITVNSIIISVIVSLLLRNLDENIHLALPSILLLIVSLTTIVLAILSTRPNIPRGKFTQQDLDEKKTNLLFFGNFYKMNFERYNAGMHQLMNDRDFLHNSFIKDIYKQGIVLGKKYRLLRAAYNIFMFGLVASVIAFIIASVVTL